MSEGFPQEGHSKSKSRDRKGMDAWVILSGPTRVQQRG